MSPLAKEIAWFVVILTVAGAVFSLAYGEWQYRKADYFERRSRFGKFKVEVPK